MDIENIKKILVIRLGAVGDIIRTLPAVKYIFEFYKKQNKEIIIHWLAEKHNSNILKDLPYIDKIYKLPRRDWQNRLISKDFFKVLREFNEFIKKIKNEKYDAVIDFHGIFKSGLLSYLSGCPVRIGYTKEYCKELNFMFNNVRIAAKSQKITRIEKNFALVSYFDTSYEIPEKFDNLLNITEPDKFVVDNFLKEKKINNFICINPAVSKFGKYKEWREDYYARLTELILNFAGEINIIFTWGPGELEKINRIIKGIDFNKIAQKTERIFIAPQTTLKELAYLISLSKFIITGDTGPMHLAAILNVPIVALFGPSDPIINAPFGKNNIVIFENVGCNPCRRRTCKKLKCQDLLTPEKVLKRIIENKFI